MGVILGKVTHDTKSIPVRNSKLMLCGVGIHDYAVLGAVHALAKADKLKEYSVISSCSSIPGFMLALGADLDTIGTYLNVVRPLLKENIANRLEESFINDVDNLTKIKTLKNHSQYISGDLLYDFAQLIVQDTFGKPNATFTDLSNFVNAQIKNNKSNKSFKLRNLEIFATISTKTKPKKYMQVMFSKELTPNLPIALAIRLANCDFNNLKIIELSSEQIDIFFNKPYIDEIAMYEVSNIIGSNIELKNVNFENCILSNFSARVPLYTTLNDTEDITIIAPMPQFIIDAINNFTNFKSFKKRLSINTNVDDFFEELDLAIIPDAVFN